MPTKPVNQVTCCVVDQGMFVHVARRLARDYKKVYYFSPWQTGFPHIKDAVVGDGYPEIERVRSPWEVLDECDLFVFPAQGFAEEQALLKRLDKPVWGAGGGAELEENRGKFLEALAQTKLPVPKFREIIGLTTLKNFLEKVEDKYIKFNTYRGDFETVHWRSAAEDGQLLERWGLKLGPVRDEMKFYVFEPIDTEIEDGLDTWCIDGQWPQTVVHGMEAKDSAYIGTFQKLAAAPKEIRQVNEEFGPVLKKFGYRQMFCTEVRITKTKTNYFIDPTCRFPSPPSQVLMEMIANWGEIIWQGANGVCVEPKPAAKFGVQVIFKLDRSEWDVLKLPPKLDRWVKVSYSCCVGDCVCVPPDPDPDAVREVGWLCAIGDTIEAAVDQLKAYAKEMPEGCKLEMHALPELVDKIRQAEKQGMKFTDQPVPKPAALL